MPQSLRSVGWTLLALAALTSGWGGGGGVGGGGPSSPLVFALTDAGDLISFRADAPGLVLSSAPVTGLTPSESLVGIDFRLANGGLYGVGVDGLANVRLYTIAPTTGVATLVTVSPFGLVGPGSSCISVNPSTDRIRLIVGDRSMRMHPDTGALVATDASLAYDLADPNASADPNVLGVAYSNNVVGSLPTTLFAVDTDLDALVTLGGPGGLPSPNTGLLFTVGDLGINASSSVAGFDIHTSGGVDTAYLATVTPAFATSLLFTVELASGSPTFVGAIGTPDLVVAMAVQP